MPLGFPLCGRARREASLADGREQATPSPSLVMPVPQARTEEGPLSLGQGRGPWWVVEAVWRPGDQPWSIDRKALALTSNWI